jgi:hypothetical protein
VPETSEKMSEAANQDNIPGDTGVGPNPEGAPAAHEADNADDILDADQDGPDVLVSQLCCVIRVELKYVG